MASVTVDDVRDVVNVSSTDVPDAKILKMIKWLRLRLSLKLTTKSITVIVVIQRKNLSL